MVDDDTTNAHDKSEESPVQRYGARIIKREATKTDFIVMPVAAGVLTSCVLAATDAQLADHPLRDYWTTLRELAATVVASCEEGRENEWNVDDTHHITLWGFIHIAWVALLVWSPLEFVLRVTGTKFGDPGTTKLRAAERWLREHPDCSFVEFLFVGGVACDMAGIRNSSELTFLSRSARPIRVELARRLREAGLTSWPEIVRTVRAQWNLEVVQRLTLDFSLSFGADVGYEEDAPDAKPDRTEQALQVAKETATAANGLGEEVTAPDVPAHEQTIAMQARVIRELEEHTQRLQESSERLDRERMLTAERHAGADSYAAALKRELADANATIALLETTVADLRRTNERLTQDVAVETALAPDAPGPPADTFAGRRVLLFTGQPRADTREAMRQSFVEFGASEIDVYWSDRSRGPETYPKDSIVVIDVTFMSHSSSKVIEDRALKSGAWSMLCRHGAALIAREAAARFQASQ
jgi:hypothetical protein